MSTPPLTLADLQRPNTPATVPFRVAYEALGWKRTAAYQAARAGTFTVPVIQLGPGKWVCPAASILRVLDLEPNGHGEGGAK